MNKLSLAQNIEASLFNLACKNNRPITEAQILKVITPLLIERGFMRPKKQSKNRGHN